MSSKNEFDKTTKHPKSVILIDEVTKPGTVSKELEDALVLFNTGKPTVLLQGQAGAGKTKVIQAVADEISRAEKSPTIKPKNSSPPKGL